MWRRWECRLNLSSMQLPFVLKCTAADDCAADSLLPFVIFFMFSFSDLLSNICFLMRSHVSAFSFPSWSCFVPFCFCLSRESASHAFLSRTLCFMSAFQPLNHIRVTSSCAHTRTHTHADTSCCGSHAKNFLLTEFLLPLLSALLFAQSSQHSLFLMWPFKQEDVLRVPEHFGRTQRTVYLIYEQEGTTGCDVCIQTHLFNRALWTKEEH